MEETLDVIPSDARLSVRVSTQLLTAAAVGLGLPEDVRESELVRAALAHAAGLPIDEHARLPWGGDVRRMYRKETAPV